MKQNSAFSGWLLLLIEQSFNVVFLSNFNEHVGKFILPYAADEFDLVSASLNHPLGKTDSV